MHTRRASVVIGFALVVLGLMLASTTAPASRAANFGQIEKPGWGAGLNPTLVARYDDLAGLSGWGERNTVQRFAFFNSRLGAGPFVNAQVGSRTLHSATAANNCADTPFRYLNQQIISTLGFPTGARIVNTATMTDTTYATVSYTRILPTWPEVYSPTFGAYYPTRLDCNLTGAGILPPVIGGPWWGNWNSP